ncbi:MAG TPA: hypothetical protein VFB84_16635 [Micromonosporaceae bacterium]|nr:hypothetical protein [Micromonosporaceae bacterium]
MSAGLERRYRWLLACYPAEHRRVYGDEMLGVLLAGAREKQRYPGLHETVDLLLTAVRLRVRRAGAGLRDSRWTDAVAVLGVLAPVVLLAKHLRPVTDYLGWALRVDDPLPFAVAPTGWLRVAGWAAVTVAVLCGWRLVAAAGAWAGVLGEVVVLTRSDPTQTAVTIPIWWSLALALIVAVTLSFSSGGRGVVVLGWRRVALFGAAAAVAAGTAAVEPLLGTGGGGGHDIFVFALVDGRWVRPTALLAYAVAALAVVVVVAGLAPPVRRRVLALLAPMVTLLAVVQLELGSSSGGVLPVYAGPAQRPFMAATPLLVLLAGLAVLRRHERAGQGSSA